MYFGGGQYYKNIDKYDKSKSSFQAEHPLSKNPNNIKITNVTFLFIFFSF